MPKLEEAFSRESLKLFHNKEELELKKHLEDLVQEHPVSRHPLFWHLRNDSFSIEQVCRLLKNYDAHASHLRRLLLKAATIMPEKAVGFILENVRNEYGNGHVNHRHQLQLQDLAFQTGTSPEEYRAYPVYPGIKTFIKDVTWFYYPRHSQRQGESITRAAVAAGGITATEVMAIEEFRALQDCFRQFGQEHHIWFNHVQVECEHSDESSALAIYFIKQGALKSVKIGLQGVLDANQHLYDGLLQALKG
jgi:hypothetical protein